MNIWPEWTDTEEAKGKAGRGAPSLFEDSESFELPAGLQRACEHWKRPSELVMEEGSEEPLTPVIVETETTQLLDLVSSNLHLFPLSELVRWIVCQIHALWQQRDVFLVSPTNPPDAEKVQWRPWEHIYPQNKGSPILSSNGKYAVRLFWLNSWRRITIDDLLPIDLDGRLLLPSSTNPCEIWPALLSKAILKVASLDYNSPSCRGDFGEASIVYMLTGWCPQRISTQELRSSDHLWPLLLRALPLWKSSSEKGSKSPVLSPDKQEPSGVESNSSRASMKGKPAAKGSAKGDSKKPASRMGAQGKKQTADVTDKLEQLEKFAKLNPGGEPEHPSTCLLFATYKSSSECVGSFEVKKNAETSSFMRGNLIPPDQSHPLQLIEVRDRPLKPPETPPPYPAKKFPRYPGHRHRKENPFDDRLPPPTPPKEPRFIRLQSALSGTWERAEKEVVKQPLLVSLLEKVRESERTKDRVGKRMSIDINAVSETNETLPQEIDMWIEFEEFLRLFTAFYIFYRPDVYRYDEKIERMSPHALKSSTRAASGTNSRTPLTTHKSTVASHYAIDPVSESRLLYVDSCQPIHILISLSAFVNWKTKAQGSLVFQRKTKVVLRPTATPSTRSTESVHRSQRLGPPSVDKQEVLETKEAWARIVPYDWRVLGETRPLHILQTSAVNCFLLSLPPGRYAYKLSAQSPIGMVLTIRSHSRFRLVEEEELLGLLRGTPAAFQALSKRMFDHVFETALPKLRDVDEFSRVLTSHDFSPIQGHYSDMCQALFDSLTSGKEQMCLISSKYLLCKQFLLDTFKRLDPGLRVDTSLSYKARSSETREERQFSEEEKLKVTKLQFHYRVHRRVRRRLLYTSGSKENEEFCSDLTNVFESLREDLLAAWENRLYQICERFPERRAMLRLDGTHEMKIYTETYEGVTDLQNEKWALLFRDTFQLSQPNFLSFLLFTKGGAKTRLKLINNDSGKELPAVSGRLLPRQYPPAELGYTLLGEGELLAPNVEMDTMDLKWKLMVVGTEDKLPSLKSGEALQAQFFKLREKEPYLPDKDYVMFRYVLTSRLDKDTHVTLQLTTSKPEAMFRVSVQQEGEVTEVEGKGTCLIPSLLIRAPEEGAEKREYLLRCEVLRKSWSHQESAWDQYNEIKTLSAQPESTRSGTPHDGKKKGGDKKSSSLAKGAKKTAPSKITSSTVLLDRYPHWVLRLVSPHELDLSKDTRRVDEIKKMKEGWEEMDEGRAERARVTRENFIRSKLGQDSEEGSVTELDALHSETSLANPIQPVATSLELPQTDFSNHVVTESEQPRLLDASEEARREEQQRDNNRKYKAWRQAVLGRRESERKLRNNFKAKQLATIENLIKLSDEFHERILQPREKMRQTSLKAEKAREEVDSPTQGKDAKKDKKEKSPPKGKPRK